MTFKNENIKMEKQWNFFDTEIHNNYIMIWITRVY